MIDGDQFVCQGDTISLTITNLDPDYPLTHNWEPDSNIIAGDGTSTILVSLRATTTFHVTSTSNGGCVINDSVTVHVDSLTLVNIEVFADQTVIYPGESTQLHAIPDGFNYAWTPIETLDNSNAQNPIATPTETTTYTVEITENSCARIASVTIVVREFICGEPDVFLPNAFTPNQDNENDILFLRGRHVETMNLIIYNRWGEQVFETNTQNKGWDGTYKDKPVEPGVFVYYLTATCVDGQEYFNKGNITVIR